MSHRITGIPARLLVLGIGIAATIIGALIECPAVAIAAPVVAGFVMLVQFLSAGPQVVPFRRDDWVRTSEGWELEIPWRRHLRLSPNAQVWEKGSGNQFQEILCGTRTRGHTVIIEIGEGDDRRFDGEVRIS